MKQKTIEKYNIGLLASKNAGENLTQAAARIGTTDTQLRKTKRQLESSVFIDGISQEFLNLYNEVRGNKIIQHAIIEKSESVEVISDKKVGDFYWKDLISPLQKMQNIFSEGKSNQDISKWTIKGNDEICVVFLSDTHAGSWATDYDAFCDLTDVIINTPGLFVILGGDLLQMAIKLRGVLEVSDNALPPKWQLKFLESWLDEVSHKVIASTWDNHSVMREENATGYSRYAQLMEQATIYHNHIGHLNIGVNDEVYKLAISHFFRGRSFLNPLHSQMRYMRFEAPDREITMAGDSHVAAGIQYLESGLKRIAINAGSIQNSGYGRRFFSLRNQPEFPCVALSGKTHNARLLWSVKDWINEKM